MSTENLLLVINSADKSASYIVMSDSDDTFVDVIDHNRNNERTICGDTFTSLKDAVNYVIDRERCSERDGEENESLIIKAFAHFNSNNRIDINRSWVIENNGDETYDVSTEISGLKETLTNGRKLSLNSLDNALDMVAFLERVYSENNSSLGKKTVCVDMIYDKVQDILDKPFDADTLKLNPHKKSKDDMER